MDDASLDSLQLAARRAFVEDGLRSLREALEGLIDPKTESRDLADRCVLLLHRMKGGAGFVGYRHIAEVAAGLERQIRTNTGEGSASLQAMVQNGFEKLVVLLRQLEAEDGSAGGGNGV